MKAMATGNGVYMMMTSDDTGSLWMVLLPGTYRLRSTGVYCYSCDARIWCPNQYITLNKSFSSLYVALAVCVEHTWWNLMRSLACPSVHRGLFEGGTSTSRTTGAIAAEWRPWYTTKHAHIPLWSLRKHYVFLSKLRLTPPHVAS
jgi:hypothetical protein